MFQYKKEGLIYSFENQLSEAQYAQFLAGTLNGTLVGNYYASPTEVVRRNADSGGNAQGKNTIHAFDFTPTKAQLAEIQAGTLFGVFVGYVYSHETVSVPDWVQCRVQIMALSVFDSKMKKSNDWGYVSTVLFAGQQGTASTSDLLDALNQMNAGLMLGAFTAGEKTAINAVLSNCMMGIALS